MASRKSYAFQIKGNKLSLIENQFGWGAGKDIISVNGSDISHKQYTLDEIGPTGKPSWVTPVESIPEGIELEYTYTPTYALTGIDTIDSSYHQFIGWGSNGTNLMLFTYGSSAQKDLSSTFSAGDKIHLSGAGQWSGIHEVSSAATEGKLILTTKYNVPGAYITCDVDFQVDNIIGDDNASKLLIENFKGIHKNVGTPYVFVQDAVDTINNGIFEVDYTSAVSGHIDFKKKVTIDASGDYTSDSYSMLTEDDDTITMYHMFYDPLVVREGVSTMDDESFELDVSALQAKAIEAYLQAKKNEQSGNIDMTEYYMSQFKKLIERNEGSKVSGPRRIMGFGMTR